MSKGNIFVREAGCFLENCLRDTAMWRVVCHVKVVVYWQVKGHIIYALVCMKEVAL